MAVASSIDGVGSGADAGDSVQVSVNFAFHVDGDIAPRNPIVECPGDATVRDLIDVLCAKYGEKLRDSIQSPNITAVVNGLCCGARMNERLREDQKATAEVWFLPYAFNGG